MKKTRRPSRPLITPEAVRLSKDRAEDEAWYLVRRYSMTIRSMNWSTGVSENRLRHMRKTLAIFEKARAVPPKSWPVAQIEAKRLLEAHRKEEARKARALVTARRLERAFADNF
jgi:tRNA isopentenyl-2-thiomethyl-A-37 hydroxylase MiaE